GSWHWDLLQPGAGRVETVAPGKPLERNEAHPACRPPEADLEQALGALDVKGVGGVDDACHYGSGVPGTERLPPRKDFVEAHAAAHWEIDALSERAVVPGHSKVIEDTAQAIGVRGVGVCCRQERMTIDDDRQPQGLCRALTRERAGRWLIGQREPQQVSRNVE